MSEYPFAFPLRVIGQEHEKEFKLCDECHAVPIFPNLREFHYAIPQSSPSERDRCVAIMRSFMRHQPNCTNSSFLFETFNNDPLRDPDFGKGTPLRELIAQHYPAIRFDWDGNPTLINFWGAELIDPDYQKYFNADYIPPLDDKTMDLISEMKQLRFLVFSDGEFSEKSIKQLSELSELRWLDMRAILITDDYLKYLEKLTNLEKLAIKNVMDNRLMQEFNN